MKRNNPEKYRTNILLPDLLIRILCYVILWTVLTGGRMESWQLGAPAVLVATWISIRAPRIRSGRFSISGALRFMGYFLKASLISGVDVVRRALHPRLLLQPDLIDYRLSLTSEAARIFMADAVSLLPGTLSAELAEANLTVHVLDRNMPFFADIKALEKRVAAMLEADRKPLHAIGEEVR
jgi:multicomponent Na+:H+ antiporter subunit E